MIDDTVPINAEFLRRCLEKKASTSETAQSLPPKPLPSSPAATKRQARAEVLTADTSGLSYNELEKLKKQADIKLVEERTELLKKQNEKMAGESLPTEMVKALFSQHFKSVTISFKHSIEQLIIDIAKKKSLTNEEVADIRGKMTAHLNTAIKDSISESKKTLTQVATSVTIKRTEVEEPE